MRRLPLSALLLLSLLMGVPSAHAQSDQTLYADGPSGRYLLDGSWMFRLDSGSRGLRERWQRQTSTTGWAPITVPHAWNLGDDSVASMKGGVGWYRKDFKLPSAKKALDWIVRFESVNYRTRAWINGVPLGTNKGAYIPFEFQLHSLKRKGTNRLVVRVDSRRLSTDFPPSKETRDGQPAGGWWNYGGLLREVYLRKIDGVDFKTVEVTPNLPCSTCSAKVKVRVLLRNLGGTRSVRITGRFGSRTLNLGTRRLTAGGLGGYDTTIEIDRPRLWSPDSPNLYDVQLSATSGRRLASYRLKTGIREVRVSVEGRLILNGNLVSFRGVGYHEDSKEKGFAVDNAFRARLVNEVKEVGATLMRTHYPPHPYLHELADRLGVMIWSEIPVFAVRTQYLKQRRVRELAAKELRKNIEANRNHPSVIIWSIANELSSRPGTVQGHYIRRAASLARELDPTRPVGLAVAAYPSAGCQHAYAPLDVIGINEYFGWYPGPNGQLFDRSRLSGYLDQVRGCYPDKAVVISEFGAEANREGPVEEKGTYAHQIDFVRFHLGVHDSKPWLSGSVYWALNEFRVRPGWEGGNPRPNSPIHQKGMLRYGDFSRKPAWSELQRLFKAKQQFAPVGAPARRGG